MIDAPKLTRFWYRRISGTVMLTALIILGLYAWARFIGDTSGVGHELLVSDTAAILAGITVAAAVLSCLWAPKQHPGWPPLLAYTFLWVTAAVLILDTGGERSPFVALWMLIAIFAGVFGLYGLLPVALAPAIYLVWQFFNGSLAPSAMMAVILTGELPLTVSYFVWTTRPSAAGSRDRAYQQLASELSQVAGKAEVVINAITDGVMALDSQGVIQLINPAAQQVIGWGKQDALTLNYKSVLKLVDAKGGELGPATDPVVRALATNQEVRTDDLSLITNSGKKLLVSLVVSPVGQPGAGVIVVLRDITKEKAEERQQAEFISTASHEMRTPVASIEGYLGLALNPATAKIDEKAREYITKAHEGAEHLGRLFQDLLDISKAEDGRLSNNPSVVDVAAFTQDIVQGMRPKAEAKGLHLVFKPQPDDKTEENNARRLNPVYYVNVDNDHLREVIANLVDNAIKYTPHGTVAVDVDGDGEHVVISVEDSGIGIPAEDLPHLFQKFYRIDSSDTREIGGTGLGLYLCRRLCETMEGRIWVESQYKQGSTFYVELPRITHEEAMRLIETVGDQSGEPSIQSVTIPTPVPVAMAPAAAAAPAASAPPIPLEETIYTAPPAGVAAPQLYAMPPGPPAVMPGVVGLPSPAVGPPVAAAANPSLAVIEQHPEQYLRRAGNIMVPPRNKNQS